jgi:hypothetical protein
MTFYTGNTTPSGIFGFLYPDSSSGNPWSGGLGTMISNTGRYAIFTCYDNPNQPGNTHFSTADDINLSQSSGKTQQNEILSAPRSDSLIGFVVSTGIYEWSGRRDSNSRPSAPKADALPGCATPRHPYDINSSATPAHAKSAIAIRRSRAEAGKATSPAPAAQVPAAP